MAYIVGYGAYIPKYRIKSEEIAKVWGEDPERISKGLGIIEKAVAPIDIDTAVIGVEAAKIALKRAGLEGKNIEALYVGSESHPYVVKSTASIVAEAIKATPHVMAVDLEFACRAGTAGIISAIGLVDAGYIEYGMAIGADTAQGRPGDALEYSAGSGGGAFIIGKKGPVKIKSFYSYVTDTPDFWRREGAEFPSHGGRFTGEPAYFKHVINAAKTIMEREGLKPSDFSYVVLHQPNAKFPKRAAKILGFTQEQLSLGLLVPYIGNTYSGATLVGMSNVLDHSKKGDLILWVSFGSGAGSDAFVLEVVDELDLWKETKPKTEEMISNKEYINYPTYLKWRNKLKGRRLGH